MYPNPTTQIRNNFNNTLDKISSAAISVGRSPESIRLVVVSKTHYVETIKNAIAAGVREFGENYTEEAVAKMIALGDVEGLTWHMIGHIQSRKAELVAKYFDYVHTIDSLKLAVRLNRFAILNNLTLPVLLECNSGGEITKFGYPAYDTALWDNIKSEARQIAELKNLEIRGLMTMPPIFEDPEKSRPYFQHIRKLQEYLQRQVPEASWKELSMGTSVDYITAVEEGATFVRVGTAILGSRPNRN